MNDDDIDDALGGIYREIDELLTLGAMDVVDEILGAVDPSSLPIVLSLAYLSITSPAHTLLRQRTPLAARVRRHLEEADPDRADALLYGLEHPT